MQNSLKEIVESNINKLQKDINKSKDIIEKNGFIFGFEWVMEDMFKNTYKHNVLQHLLDFIIDNPERTEDWLESNIKTILGDLRNGRFTNNSTSTFSNLSFIYKKEVNCVLLQDYEYYLKLITNEKEPLPIL